MIGLAMIAFALAYGRVTQFALYHMIVVVVAVVALTFLTAGLFPFSGITQFAANLVFYGGIYAIGGLLGRYLDRDKYAD